MRLMPLAYLLTVCLPIAPVFAADNPSYGNGTLTIPSVDSENQVGQYQDVTFQLTPDGTWKLLNFLEKDIPNYTNPDKSLVKLAALDKVEVTTTTSFPVQVFLKAGGTYGGCERLGDTHQRFANNNFEVAINITLPDIRDVFCLAIARSFTETIPLPVYGLKAGTYTYSINGKTGSFALAADNDLK
jgi:hypothetical protein